jgi:23S rRNA pseudouridine955/2504/2580 synthase/23S rRNA pseudouridine1911/1915/1917 synthase
MKRAPRIRIQALEAGSSLSGFLTGRFTYHSQAQWDDCVRAGEVLLNHQRTHPSAILSAGDIVEYMAGEVPEPAVDPRFSVLFEDAALLVVNKPPNLPCHPGGRYFNNTLWAVLKTRCNLPYLTCVNRIDRETSGIVLLAKTASAALHCSQQFESQDVYKRYVVLVEGDFPAGTVRASGYLISDPASPVRKKMRFHPAESFAEIPETGKVCTTRFHRITHRSGITLLEAMPKTGRSHQIRATLCSMGYPVVGDKLYGVDERLFLRFIVDKLNDEDRERLRLPRQALHSAELDITHPGTGKTLSFHAPIPDDMNRLLRNP